MIYADNAATTKLNKEAFEAMTPFLLEFYANASQPYSFSRKAKRALKDARRTIAGCINAEPEEIYFTSGGTESDNWAIKNFCPQTDIRHIITSPIEHHAILNACKSISYNSQLSLLSVDSKGIVSEKSLLEIFTRPREVVASCKNTLVSVMLANNEIGTIQPIKELCEIAHSHGAYFHTDAVQAVGHIPIDVKDLGVDMLSASAHKFNGTKGIGFLYIKKSLGIIQAFHNGGMQENGLRAGTENVASVVAMAYALKSNCDNMNKNISHLKLLEDAVISILDKEHIDYLRNGINQLPGNVNLSFKGVEGEMLLHRLDLKNICVSTGAACDSQNQKATHVIEAIGVPDEYKYGTIRISFGFENTMEEAKVIANALVSIIKCSGNNTCSKRQKILCTRLS
ncbi:MAG: cysteine desulfurase [Ruminococcus sp.]|nr:cysteine desulfurase [Ruminococcus sp.]